MSNLTRALAGALAVTFLTAAAQADELIVRDTLERLQGVVTLADGQYSVQARTVPAKQVLVHLRDDGGADLPAADACEDEALLHESRGRFEAGFHAYAEATRLTLAAVEADAAVELAAARLELYLRRLDFFAGRAGRRDQALNLCQQAAELNALPAFAKDAAWTYAAAHLRALGRFGEAADVDRQKLGVITNWYLAGSFDNERGTGEAKPYPPEQEPLDLQASWPGKQFPVHWRRQPLEQPPGGVIDLDQLLRPNDQSLAYAVCQVRAEARAQVAIHLGSDDGWSLWVNRQALGARPVQRPFRPDQDRVIVQLEPGVNEILLKLHAQTGAWRFRVRLSAPEGGPLSGVEVLPVPDPEAAFAPASEQILPKPRRAIDVLRARAAERGDDWRSWFHLGYLSFAKQAHDRGQHPDRDALTKACELAPKAAFLRLFLSFALQGEAQFSVNREDNARRLALEEALALDPGSSEARVLLARYFANDLGNVDRARALLAPALEETPHYAELAVLAAELDGRLGLGPLATARLSKLHEELAAKVKRGELGAVPAPLLRARLSAASDRNDVKAQVDLLIALARQDARSANIPFRQATLCWRAGRGVDAEHGMRQAVALDPYDVNLRRQLAQLLASRGDLDAAAAALSEALEIAPDDAALVADVGHLALRMGDEARAEAQLAKALELDPNDVKLREYVEFRARHAAKEPPFEAQWTLDTAPLVAAARERELEPRLTHRYLLRQKVAKVYVDGRTSTFVQELIRIENEVGARQLAGYGTRYESDQQLEFQLGRVYRQSGGHEDVPVQTFRPRRGGEFTRGLQGGVRFPPLEPGDVVEVRYRTDDLEAGFFGDYFGEVTYFQGDQPLDLARYVLVGPTERTFHFHAPGFESLGGTHEQRPGDAWTAHVFTARDVPKFESEPNQPWAKESLPQVQVSTFKDWDHFATWYWGLVRGQHEADPAIKAKVQELCEGAQTPLEKIRRIYNYVVTDIRYNASWEFGVHGFKPYNATRIYARKFGDCKDKSTLINTMLREVGIDSHPVLIFGETARGSEDLTLPLMGHFNHCISWVDFGEGGIFVDGTAEHHPFGTLPTMDYGATVVVITPEKGILREIPFRDSEANSVHEQHRVKLGDDGRATVESVIEGKGDFEIMLRSWLATVGRRKEVLEPRIGSVFNGAHVKSVECSDLTDLDQPVRVKVEVELPRVTQATTSGKSELQEIKSWLFDMIYLRGRKLANLAADAERKQDLILPVPSEVEETVIYELPPGTKIESLPPPTELETDFGRYERVYTKSGNTLEVKRVLKIETHRIPASAYQEFRTFVGEIERAESLSPVLGKGGTEQ
jgi:tetratricopeptide (TPR) repeat protein